MVLGFEHAKLATFKAMKWMKAFGNSPRVALLDEDNDTVMTGMEDSNVRRMAESPRAKYTGSGGQQHRRNKKQRTG